jgi:hypothetical protein
VLSGDRDRQDGEEGSAAITSFIQTLPSSVQGLLLWNGEVPIHFDSMSTYVIFSFELSPCNMVRLHLDFMRSATAVYT